MLSDTQTIAAHWLQLRPSQRPAPADSVVPENVPGVNLPMDGSLSLDEMEKRIIGEALDRSDNNVTAAARLLGTSRETLRYRVNKYGFKPED